MPSKELLEDVGKYIDKYYRPEIVKARIKYRI